MIDAISLGPLASTPPMVIFVVTMLAAFGLVIGSYLNVVIYRLPAGISTVYPGSRCPRCLMPVKPWDNVPVVSYLLLGAKCRFCRGHIALRYPLVEALTSILFVAAYWRYSADALSVVVACGLSACLVALALIDWDHREVPLALVWSGLVLGLGVQPWLGWTDPFEAFFGAWVGGGGLWLIAGVWQRLTGERGFEDGDVWVLALIGAFGGPVGVIKVFVAAALVAVSVTALSIAVRQVPSGSSRLRRGIPFVTYLSAGALGLFLMPV